MRKIRVDGECFFCDDGHTLRHPDNYRDFSFQLFNPSVILSLTRTQDTEWL